MNPNDILAQQQAYLNQMNQALQHSQQQMWAIGAIGLALFIIHVWVIYMFYARLRDIAEELMRLRIAFEMAEDRKARAAGVTARPPGAAAGENPFASDELYKPKPGK